MYELWLIVLATALVNNVVLTQFVGTDASVRDGFSLARARFIGMASGGVLVATGAAAWWLDRLLFTAPSFAGLRLFVFAVLVACISLPAERMMRTLAPLGAWGANGRIPLIMANSMALGGTLITVSSALPFLHALAVLIGLAVGFVASLVVLAALNERVESADVPQPFRGGALSIIVAGFLALALGGLVGLVNT